MPMRSQYLMIRVCRVSKCFLRQELKYFDKNRFHQSVKISISIILALVFQIHAIKFRRKCTFQYCIKQASNKGHFSLQSWPKYLGLQEKSLEFSNHKRSSFFNYVVENEGVSTGEFQHRLETLDLCILALKGLNCSFKLRDIA